MEHTKEDQEHQDNANVGTSLVESLWSSSAGDIAAEAAEIALDAVLDEGLLEKVPVFGWLVKGYSVVMSVRDRVFLKKVANFLSGMRGVSEEERGQFRDKISADPHFAKKVGEALILLLERHEDFEKSLILGKVFAGYMKGTINYETFAKLANVIDRAFIIDLKNLEIYYSKLNSYDSSLGKPFVEFLDDATCQSLYNAGLIRNEGYYEDIYHPNQIGEAFVKLLKE
jgi:hypothetical protein